MLKCGSFYNGKEEKMCFVKIGVMRHFGVLVGFQCSFLCIPFICLTDYLFFSETKENAERESTTLQDKV